LLSVEVVEARLEAREALLAALVRELSLLEGLVVALQGLLGAGDLGADRGEPLLGLEPVPLGFFPRLGERFLDQVAVALDVGELDEHGLHDLTVTLGQVRSELEHAVSAYPRRARLTTIGSHGIQRTLLLCRGTRRCRITRPHARFRAFPGTG
jgi:hypothetical protein